MIQPYTPEQVIQTGFYEEQFIQTGFLSISIYHGLISLNVVPGIHGLGICSKYAIRRLYLTVRLLMYYSKGRAFKPLLPGLIFEHLMDIHFAKLVFL